MIFKRTFLGFESLKDNKGVVATSKLKFLNLSNIKSVFSYLFIINAVPSVFKYKIILFNHFSKSDSDMYFDEFIEGSCDWITLFAK